jgi:OmpA-OmpF porin, OOP family
MKKLLFTLTVCIAAGSVLAQETDTLIYAQGKIVSAVTKEPINAKISFQSEPFGNRTGILNGTSYSFPLFDGEKYSIVVEAPGFAVTKYLLDPALANTERIVIKDIELALPGSVAKTSETVPHTVGHTMILDNLIFAIGTARISSESYEELNELVKMLKDYPRMVIQLEGHTDVKGDPRLNMKLSQERVDAVKSYLIGKGASKGRIKTKAFGGTSPLSKENTEQAHKMNRRVEVRVLEN